MEDQAPYGNPTDQDILRELQSIALKLLEYNREDRAYQWGERLYEIHKYLEDRLSGDLGKGETQIQTGDPAEIPEDLKGVIDALKANNVNVFLNCRVETVHINNHGERG